MTTLEFYEVSPGMIMCNDCIEEWKRESKAGNLVGDEMYNPELVRGLAETPAQCDGCLTQSDDYDDVLEDEG